MSQGKAKKKEKGDPRGGGRNTGKDTDINGKSHSQSQYSTNSRIEISVQVVGIKNIQIWHFYMPNVNVLLLTKWTDMSLSCC